MGYKLSFSNLEVIGLTNGSYINFVGSDAEKFETMSHYCTYVARWKYHIDYVNKELVLDYKWDYDRIKFYMDFKLYEL